VIVGLAAAFAAAIAYGAATVMEQIGARRVDTTDTIDPRLLLRVTRQVPFAAGLVLDLGGFLLAALALRTLPLFAVQSAVASSVGFTALLGAVVLGTRIKREQRWPLVALGVGLALASLSASTERAVRADAVGRALFVGGVAAIALLAAVWRPRPGDRSAAALGSVAGPSFAGAYLAARVLVIPHPFIDLARDPVVWCMAAFGGLGILILTNARQRGSVTVVTAAMFGVETVVPAVIGLAFLHDRARFGLWPVAAAGFLLSVGGSVALALRTPAEVEVTTSA